MREKTYMRVEECDTPKAEALERAPPHYPEGICSHVGEKVLMESLCHDFLIVHTCI
jgi:hypothetical protein